MAKKIVIVESNAKARTIGRYLGKDYVVKASRGHVRDLPRRKFGVDVEQGFEPTYQVMPGSRKIVKQLRDAAGKAEEVYLAPDPDREGEAIAWHLQHVLELDDESVNRVTFNEITQGAVREAFQDPRRIDRNLVDAQQARRILDRIVGYELSPLISKKVVRGLSAGRVQSVALRLIVERERERDAFEPEEYWEIRAILSPSGGEQTFEAELKEIEGEDARIATEAEAGALVERLQPQEYRVVSVEQKISRSKAPPPFITSTMQQAASSALRFTAAQTMRLAQQLYEGIEIEEGAAGLITYMRTDSPRVAKPALAACREFIAVEFGGDYLPEKPNFFRSPRGAQAAHEAIRPTDVKRRPEQIKRHLSPQQFKLYELIWRRFVASQMEASRHEVTTVGIEAGPGRFEARGRRLLFDGYARLMPSRSEDQVLPPLAEGDELDLRELISSQHFTQPPPRYSEATLVRELERQGIGRPSTYAPTISTLLRRHYVRRERRALSPTDLGMAVTDLLVEHFPREMDVGFTSRLEEELDEIEEGRRDWRNILSEFYQQFSQNLEQARENMERPTAEGAEERACEKCGKPMVVRFSRRGDRFLGCTGYPECDFTVSLQREGEEPVETEFKCDKCGSPMLRRTGRRGRDYLACSGYPECRNIMGLDREGQPVELEQQVRTGFKCPRCAQDMYAREEGAEELICRRCSKRVSMLSVAEALERTELDAEELALVCEECGSPMQLKRSRRGLFLGCTKYPECKGTRSLAKGDLPAAQPTHERCEKCGRPMAVRWGQYGRFLSCTGFPRCRNLWRLSKKRKPCPREGCGGELIKKADAERGAFYGCTRSPDCDHTEPAPEKRKKD